MTVLPLINNICERILSDQLLEYFKVILSDFISTYRKNYRCESTLLRLIEDLRTNLDNKEAGAAMPLRKGVPGSSRISPRFLQCLHE